MTNRIKHQGLSAYVFPIALVPAYLQTTTSSLAAPKPGLSLWLTQTDLANLITVDSLSVTKSDHFVMHLNASYPDTQILDYPTNSNGAVPVKPLEWDWEVEHADRKREAKADAALHGAIPFQVDRKILKDVVREKMGVDVGRIAFLSSGVYAWRSEHISAGTNGLSGACRNIS